VLADANERRELISKRTEELASAGRHGHRAAGLLDEVTALVEWPVPLVCSFEERFLDVPQEALITTMQDNQKYFCLLDATASCCRASSPWPTSKAGPAADHRR
jgi:glycyl-tRNA synthetase beta chain